MHKIGKSKTLVGSCRFDRLSIYCVFNFLCIILSFFSLNPKIISVFLDKLTIIMIYLYIYLFNAMYIYLSVRNALPMIPLIQVKVSYIPRFYRLPLKHFFSYYYTIFKLILFQYDTSLSNNFCGIIDQCG